MKKTPFYPICFWGMRDDLSKFSLMSYKTLTNSLREDPLRSKWVTRKNQKYWSSMSRTLGQESLPKTFPDYSLALASYTELQT